MRPSRTRRAPVAADGTLLTAPKAARRSSGGRASEARSDTVTTESSRQSSSARASPVQKRRAAPSPAKKATGPSKRRKFEETKVQDESESDISDLSDISEIEDVQPPLAASPHKQAFKQPGVCIDEESDIEFEDAPALSGHSSHASSSRLADAAPAARPLPHSIASPLDDLPLAARQKYVSRARRIITAVLSGQLPPAGQDAGGDFDGSECIGMEEQWRTLHSTIQGTLGGEGNSALLVGGPGTGKDLLMRSVLRSLQGEDQKKRFHLVRLDAARQETDRQSLRELALQLVRAGAIQLPKPGEEGALDLNLDAEERRDVEDDDDEGGQRGSGSKLGAESTEEEAIALQNAILSSLANTTSTILTLLSSGQSGSKSKLPLIVQLSSFDLYTSRPRQALLYVLLDAVQAGSYTPGLCVIGTTTRVDTTDLLEKRVRSRFSGRTINVWTSVPWKAVLQRTLMLGMSANTSEDGRAFNEAWTTDVERISKDKTVLDTVSSWEGMGNDIGSLYRRLFPIVASLSTELPSIHAALLDSVSRRAPRKNGVLDDLTMPEFALLIAAKQLLGKDREVFNFAMCYDELRHFVSRVERDRAGASSSVGDIRRYANESVYDDESVASSPQKRASMQVNVAWTGLRDRRRVMTAFRSLLSLELFQPETILNALVLPNTTTTTAASAGPSAARRAAQSAKTDFVRVKCTLFPQTIVEAAKSKTRVEPLNIHLVQWATSQS